MRGPPKSPEHRAAISFALMGKRLSDEAIEKMRVSKTGAKIGSPSQSHRAAISRALTGRRLSEEHLEKMRAFRHTEQSKAKMTKAKRGSKLRPRDPEHTAKQQASASATRARKRMQWEIECASVP